MFEANVEQSGIGMIALDDVSFTDGCKLKGNAGGCENNQFQCNDLTCIDSVCTKQFTDYS